MFVFAAIFMVTIYAFTSMMELVSDCYTQSRLKTVSRRKHKISNMLEMVVDQIRVKEEAKLNRQKARKMLISSIDEKDTVKEKEKVK